MTLTLEWLSKFNWPHTLLTGHPLAIAHRGASDYAPENTHKAFQIAADLCSEMWELDIHLSADGVCVITHDSNLKRIIDQDIDITQLNWVELSQIKLPEGQKILRLEDVISLAKQTGCGLYIEIKGAGASYAAWQVLRNQNFQFACLSSFKVDWIAELRTQNCEYPLSILVPSGHDPIDYIAGVDVDIIHICWRNATNQPDQLLTNALFQKIKNYQIILWDEDRKSVIDKLLDKPVMGICSNRPEMLKPYQPALDKQIDIVCHRGANNLAPENTLEAAQICIDQRFQYVELDVRTTSDGNLVVIHDADLQRTTSGTGLVIEHTLAQIQALDAGSWFREGGADLKVPTLREFFESVNGRAGVYVEIKRAEAREVLETVKAHNMLEKCFFWSGDIKLMRWLRQQSPDIILMAPRWKFSSVSEAVSTYAAQIIEFDVERDNLAEIKQCHALGVRSMIYSRRSEWDELASYIKYKPDMVNLDYPDRFKILASYPKVRRHFQKGHINEQ